MEKQKTFLSVLVHFFIWGFFLSIPVIILWRHVEVDLLRIFKQNAVTLTAAAVLFYTNYSFLVEKLLSRKKYLFFILVNILIIISLSLAATAVKTIWIESVVEKKVHPTVISRSAFIFFREVGFLILILAFSIIIKLLSALFVSETEKKEEEKRRKEAELINLRQQINPHFLFNTLNNIYALIEVSPEKAQNVVLELSKLLRYVLYDDNEYYVPVYKELDFIKNYIELMRIRLTDNIDVRVDIQVPPLMDKVIAPMIFISLIENAFKHGVSYSQASFIHIDFHLIENRIVCLIRNTYFPKNESDRSGSGIGLDNLRRRLDILYPHKHILKCEIEENVYVSELVIPIYDEKNHTTNINKTKQPNELAENN